MVALPDGSILNRYWDDRDTPRDESYREDTELARGSARPARQLLRDLRAAAESGWDFSSRWLADARTRATIETTEIVPVDLNSLLFGLETAIRAGCQRQADEVCAPGVCAPRGRAPRGHRSLSVGSADRRLSRLSLEAARAHCARLGRHAVSAVRRAGSADQAAAVAHTAIRELLRPGGIVTTPLVTGQQWDAPNGWAPLQWIAVAGLRRYGQGALAESDRLPLDEPRQRGLSAQRQAGREIRCDRPTRGGGGGEYPLQDGFGWTNGVMRKLMALYPADAAVASADQCPAPDMPEEPLNRR